MSYGNNANDVKTLSAHYVETKNKQGNPSKYFSFTMEISGSMYTFRVYALSDYKPTSGKNKDKTCIPVRVQRWQKTPRGSSRW